MWRAATRWTGSASSGIRMPPAPSNSSRKRTAPEPPTDGGAGQLAEPLRELLRAHHRRLPEAGARRRRRGRRRPRRGSRRGPRGAPRSRPRRRSRRRARPACETPRPGLPRLVVEPFRGRDPDPQAGERAGPEPDRDQVDGVPAARRRRRSARPRPRRPVAWRGRPRSESPRCASASDLAVAPGGGGGVGGRGVEADDDQEARPRVPTSRERRWCRLSCPSRTR